MRHDNGGRALGATQHHAHKLPGRECAICVRKLGACGVSSRVRVGFVIGEIQFTDGLQCLPLGGFEPDDIAAGWQFQCAAGELGLRAVAIILGDREIDVNRIGLRHRRQQAVAGGVGQRAFHLERTADCAGDRRHDIGIAQVHARAGQLRLRLLVLCLGNVK